MLRVVDEIRPRLEAHAGRGEVHGIAVGERKRAAVHQIRMQRRAPEIAEELRVDRHQVHERRVSVVEIRARQLLVVGLRDSRIELRRIAHAGQ